MKVRSLAPNFHGKLPRHDRSGITFAADQRPFAAIPRRRDSWCAASRENDPGQSDRTPSQQSHYRTFIERDLPALGVNVAADTMRRFWSMLAHHPGQLWNASEIGRSFGVTDTTVRSYLDKLTDALVVRQLKPWHENLGKRQVKSPKIYVRDSGLLHMLLNLTSGRDIEGHPLIQAIKPLH